MQRRWLPPARPRRGLRTRWLHASRLVVTTSRLWTIQHGLAAAKMRRGSYRASWDFVSPDSRIAYEWMMGSACCWPESSFPPIWCWHSCHGQIGNPPTIEVASDLFDLEHFAKSMMLVELEVPNELIWLSSFSLWNEFLCDIIEFGRVPSESDLQTLRSGVFVHEDDHIQAVLPYTKSEWVRKVSTLAGGLDQGGLDQG